MNGISESSMLMLKGIVIPVDWDQHGKVRTVEILTNGEGEFEVAPGGAGDQLKVHVRREVLAEAMLLDTAGNIKQVRVESFAILDWVDSDDSNITLGA